MSAGAGELGRIIEAIIDERLEQIIEDMVPELYTVGEIAERLHASRGTIQAAINRGDLVAYRIGEERGIRVRAQDVKKWLEESRASYSPRNYTEEAEAWAAGQA